MGHPFERLRQAHRDGDRAARIFVRRWAVGMVLLALAGVGASWYAAHRAAQISAQHSREKFRLEATQVDGKLSLEVEHETDLLLGAAAFVQDHPGWQPSAFRRWTRDTRAVQRYPELIALAEMRDTHGLDACPQLVFAGPAWILKYSALGAKAVCAGIDNAQLASSGKLVNFGFDMLGMRFMGEDVPVYRTVSVPATAAARRREFLGAVAIALYPQVLLRNALANYPELQIQLKTRVDDALTFRAGPQLQGKTFTNNLSNGLTEIITGRVQGSSIFDDRSAILVLGGGSAVSVLLALALFLLGTGRARAMRLVNEKTGELAFQALHDGLTGLPNRMLVMDRIGHALARGTRGAAPLAVLFIDVDGFKGVNDTFGHGAGDELLRTVGARLHGLIREADTVGRLGGDEFIVLLEPDNETAPAPELVAERILELLSQPIELGGGMEVRLSASIGIAVGQRESTEQLLRDADLALYAAKHKGKNRYVVFEDAMQTAIADRHALELDLRRAIAHNELFLVYQPTFRLADRRIGGVEALLRWQHPTRGLIRPDVFIPIAEDSGLILEIGRWVANAACTQAAAWRARGLALEMAINVSGKQLDEDGFVDEIREILEQTELPAAALTLEITETSLMRQPDEAAERLQELKLLGVQIAIDDFGTGYSSLAYLSEFPVDSLKIDRTFISGLGDSGDAPAFVSTLVQLGRTLEIRTVGEGIEDEAQLAKLLEADCNFGQGFLLARPLPAEQVEALLVDDGLADAVPSR